MSIGTILGAYTMFAMPMIEMEMKSKEKCKQLRAEYKNLQNLPRKKKKKEKKRILLEYAVFSNDPITGMQYGWACE